MVESGDGTVSRGDGSARVGRDLGCYRIAKEELEWLEGQVTALIKLVDEACREHLDKLQPSARD